MSSFVGGPAAGGGGSTPLVRPVPIASLSETIESAAYGNNILYLGTASGQILSFTVVASNRGDDELANSGVLQRAVDLFEGRGRRRFLSPGWEDHAWWRVWEEDIFAGKGRVCCCCVFLVCSCLSFSSGILWKIFVGKPLPQTFIVLSSGQFHRLYSSIAL